jgi:tRNA (mo5U34)-methyltransferase
VNATRLTAVPATPEPPITAQISSHPLWYHTLELGDGVVTPGWFDLRPIVDRMPWPDVRGKRCLDVGTWDGFLAFELERRGASEVVATDITDPTAWDWPLRARKLGPQVVSSMAGEKNGMGFELARRALNSSVERIEVNVYDLDPDVHGVFDVVVCGDLMLHLRDPVRALEAIRGVCGGHFLSAEQVRPELSVLHPRKPVAHFLRGENCQWWIYNRVGHRDLVATGGFSVERAAKPYTIPLGVGHPSRSKVPDLRTRVRARLLAGGRGLPHSAVLARPEAG